MPEATLRGRFLWHELMTTSVDSAIAFYKRVIGWKTEDWSQDPSYRMFAAKSGPMAGVMLLPEDAKAMGSPPCWILYVGTPNVDETSRLAVQLGGKVLKQPEDIPNVGRFSVLQDPQGAVFCAFTPGASMAAGEMKKPGLGEHSWHELMTTDWESAFRFYSNLFGWEKTGAMDMGPGMGTYQMYGWGEISLGGMFNKPAAVPAPPHWMPYVLVPDVKKVAAMTEEMGGRVLNGPMEVPGGDWVVQCMDPQGAAFAAHSRKPAEPRPAAKKPAAKKPAAKKKAAAKKPAKKKAAAKKKAVKKAARKRPARKAARKKAARRKAPRRAAARKKGSARRRSR